MTLRGLAARLDGVPQIRCTIVSAEVRSLWSSVTRAELGKVEIAVDGDATAVGDALAAWSAAHRGKGAKADEDTVGGEVDVPVAHLVWLHPSGSRDDVTRVEATGLSGAIGSPTSVLLGDELHFLASGLVLETKAGTFGPWSLDVDATTKGMRARLAFDPAVPDGANALFVLDTPGGASFDVTIPRLSAGGLGIPRTVLGPDLPFPQQLDVAIHYARQSHEQLTGSVRAALYGLRIAELGGSVDAHLTGEATGSGASGGGAMQVKNGLFTLGGLRATVTGSVTPGARGAKANLAWRADPVPCASLAALPTPGAAALDLTAKAAGADLGDLGQLARDFGALGEAVGAVKVTGVFSASGTLVVDSSDLGHAKFTTVAKNACGVALFQGK